MNTVYRYLYVSLLLHKHCLGRIHDFHFNRVYFCATVLCVKEEYKYYGLSCNTRFGESILFYGFFLLQNELLFDNNGCLVLNLDTFNFMKDLKWNNVKKEIETLPDSVFKFWDQKNLKEKLFKCIEDDLLLTGPIYKWE